jgi:uncharacterized protein (TIRG00374 family)
MSQKRKGIVVLLVGGLLLWWFIARIDTAAVGEHLREVKLWPLVVASLLINLTLVFRSLRWQVLLAPVVAVPFRPLLAATSVGFGSIFVVGRVGEIIRPAVLSLQERLRPSLTVASIFVERLCDTTAVVLLFSLNLVFFSLPAETPARIAQVAAMRTLGGLLTLGVFCGIGVLLLLRWRSVWVRTLLLERLYPLAPRLMRPMLNFVHHLTDSLAVLTNLRALALTTASTGLVWGTGMVASWLVSFAFDVPLSLQELIFFLGFGMVGSVVPTPGGSAGAFHAAAAAGLEFLGLEPNLAASMAIIYHLVAFGPPFLMALYFLIRDDLSLRQLREALASEQSSEPPAHPSSVQGGPPQ